MKIEKAKIKNPNIMWIIIIVGMLKDIIKNEFTGLNETNRLTYIPRINCKISRTTITKIEEAIMLFLIL
ncbi:hypothetical protein [Thermoplasma sp.]|uniref:hypothetical protein n=1 Tax=Thermoplasma sp. TaxID=1973142 RepID=UPI002621E5C4|nr:hypothetical protein [Thermoplasma sp.]